MNIFYYELEGFMYLFSFIISLIAMLFIFQIIKRTNQMLKRGYLLLFFSVLIFGIWMSLFVFSHFQIIDVMVFSGVISIVFVILFIFGIWSILEIVKDIADFGQTLIVVNKDNYNKRILSLLKQSEKVCYLFFTTETPSPSTKQLISNQSSLVITNKNDLSFPQVVYIDQANSDSIKKVLNRSLQEKRYDTVILDSITSLNNVESFELPFFVQQISEIMKKHNVAGYFIADNDKINYSIIDDISMVIDRVER